jgi:tetratricopeptide (TPR) repeat protein
LSALTFLFVGDNNFSLPGRITWIASLIAWLVAFWNGPLSPRIDLRVIADRVWRGEINIRLTRTLFLVIAVLILSASFRFARLNDLPVAMTSDHVEKLRDVNEMLNSGRRPIFEPANGGREPMEFYLAALVAQFAGTGLSHLTLKLVTAMAGFATLPIIFLFAREISDDDLTALLATLAAGIGWWPNVISRNGLRFPFAPLFAALALWLIVRALKRNRRNDALLAGLALGIGLYGYTPIRVVPAAVALALGIYALHKWRKAEAIKAAGWLVMLSLIATAAFVPLIRYAFDEPENFWRRGWCQFRLGRWEEALQTWEHLSTVRGKAFYPQVLYWKALILESQGQASKSKETLEKLTAEYPLTFYGFSAGFKLDSHFDHLTSQIPADEGVARLQWEEKYPRSYRDRIEKEAKRRNLDPYFLFAVISK